MADSNTRTRTVTWTDPRAALYTSLETKVNFVRPITAETGPVRCEAVVVYRGGRVATSEGKLFAEKSGKLLATAPARA